MSTKLSSFSIRHEKSYMLFVINISSYVDMFFIENESFKSINGH